MRKNTLDQALKDVADVKSGRKTVNQVRAEMGLGPHDIIAADNAAMYVYRIAQIKGEAPPFFGSLWAIALLQAKREAAAKRNNSVFEGRFLQLLTPIIGLASTKTRQIIRQAIMGALRTPPHNHPAVSTSFERALVRLIQQTPLPND